MGAIVETETVSASESYAEVVSATVLQSVSMKLQRSADWDDLAILDPLCKRNYHQHRRTDYFSRVTAVLRCGQLHQQAKVADSWKVLASVTRDVSDKDVPFGKIKLVVPSQEAAVAALAELLAEVHLCTRMAKLCTTACELLMSQMAHSFFLPFCVTAAATISTLRISSSSHLMQCVSIYNSLIPVAAALPRRHAVKAGDGLCLPESLGVQWMHGLPCVVGHPFEHADGFHQLGLQLCAQHDVAYTGLAMQTDSLGLRTIESDMAERARFAQNEILHVFEDTGHARPEQADKPVLFETMPGFELGPSLPNTGLTQTGYADDHLDSGKASRSNASALERDVPPKLAQASQQMPQGERNGPRSKTATDWKTILLQKQASKKTGAVPIEGISQQSSDAQKRRKVALVQTRGKVSGPVKGNKHAIGESKESKGMDPPQQNTGKVQVSNFMDLLTHGSQPQ